MLQLQPELADLREQGVDLYVVASGKTSDVEHFFDSNQLEAIVIHDQDYKIGGQYGVTAVPFVLIIDKEGRVAFAQLGWGGDTYEATVMPLLTTLLAE